MLDMYTNLGISDEAIYNCDMVDAALRCEVTDEVDYLEDQDNYDKWIEQHPFEDEDDDDLPF